MSNFGLRNHARDQRGGHPGTRKCRNHGRSSGRNAALKLALAESATQAIEVDFHPNFSETDIPFPLSFLSSSWIDRRIVARVYVIAIPMCVNETGDL